MIVPRIVVACAAIMLGGKFVCAQDPSTPEGLKLIEVYKQCVIRHVKANASSDPTDNVVFTAVVFFCKAEELAWRTYEEERHRKLNADPRVLLTVGRGSVLRAGKRALEDYLNR